LSSGNKNEGIVPQPMPYVHLKQKLEYDPPNEEHEHTYLIIHTTIRQPPIVKIPLDNDIWYDIIKIYE